MNILLLKTLLIEISIYLFMYMMNFCLYLFLRYIFVVPAYEKKRLKQKLGIILGHLICVGVPMAIFAMYFILLLKCPTGLTLWFLGAFFVFCVVLSIYEDFSNIKKYFKEGNDNEQKI